MLRNTLNGWGNRPRLGKYLFYKCEFNNRYFSNIKTVLELHVMNMWLPYGSELVFCYLVRL